MSRYHGHAATCEECHRKRTDVRKSERVEPSLKTTVRRLCEQCRSKGGFRPVTFDRGPANWATSSVSRRVA